jgi:flavin-dependent dehydrogenase
VCGEFLSPEILPTLASWGITPSSQIKKLSIQSKGYTLPSPGGALSRDKLEAALLHVAREAGAHILLETRVTNIEPGFRLTLSTGETLTTRELLIGSGRILGTPPLPYIGYKAHTTHLNLASDLEMIAEKGRYTGISHLGDGLYNIATLALAGTDPYPLHLDWMETRVPHFGVRKTPHWPHAYFIGDAAGSIAPLCGGGLSMAINSGLLAAEHALHGNWQTYRRAWQSRYRRPLQVSRLLNHLALKGLAPPKLLFPLLFRSTRLAMEKI